jgi:hypothetical protein
LSWFDQPAPGLLDCGKGCETGQEAHEFFGDGQTSDCAATYRSYEGVFQVSRGAIPLLLYQRPHPGSAVTLEQLAVLKQYLQSATPDGPATPAAIAAADAQYDEWMQTGDATQGVSPAPDCTGRRPSNFPRTRCDGE